MKLTATSYLKFPLTICITSMETHDLNEAKRTSITNVTKEQNERVEILLKATYRSVAISQISNVTYAQTKLD